jgi:HlyD family secretion protein
MRIKSGKVGEILLMLLIAAGLAACEDRTQPRIVLGTLEWDRVELLANQSETILRIDVAEGDSVEENQLLLMQDQRLAKARLEGAIAARENARARLDEVLRGPREEVIAEARAVLQGAESRLLEAELEVKRQTELVQRKLASDSTLDRLVTLRDSRAAERESANQNLKAAIEGSTDEEVRQAQFSLQRAATEVNVQEVHLQRLSIKAAVAGVIDSIPLKVGAQPRVGEVVIVLLSGRPFARAYLPEPLKAAVQVGDQFMVRIDGLEAEQPARVRFLSREAAFTPYFSLAERDRSRLVFEMELEFENPDIDALSAGLPLQVLIPDSQP